jgi:hypothetical protein
MYVYGRIYVCMYVILALRLALLFLNFCRIVPRSRGLPVCLDLLSLLLLAAGKHHGSRVSEMGERTGRQDVCVPSALPCRPREATNRQMHYLGPKHIKRHLDYRLQHTQTNCLFRTSVSIRGR